MFAVIYLYLNYLGIYLSIIPRQLNDTIPRTFAAYLASPPHVQLSVLLCACRARGIELAARLLTLLGDQCSSQ